MNRKLLGGGIAAFMVVVGGIFWALNAWEYQTLGPHHVRRHLVLGRVEILRDTRWEVPFVVDPRAPLLVADDLKRIKLSDFHWGEAGLLAATATVAPGKPLNGRLVFVIAISETQDGKQIRDRGIRETIAWPGGSTVAFVLPTGLFKPIRNQKTTLHLETVE
jgi:hypothetical protein